MRIGITVFIIPFLLIGFGMLFGGGFFGGFGWFAAILGLPFIALPIIMLAAIWLSPSKQTQRFDATAVLPPPTDAHESTRPCAYCGRPRAAASNTCDSCGAH